LYRVDEKNFHLPFEMRLTEKKLTSVLRQRGYRLTPQRRAVLKVIALSSDHLTPAAMHERVRREHPGIGLVTIYRTLAVLAELRLICEVHAGGSCRSYLMRKPVGHHHHLICSRCGRVVDFSDCDLSGLERRLAQENGFKIEGHLLEFLGLCPACQKWSRA
jgi:Fur family ferric uptake transcriptional regulator